MPRIARLVAVNFPYHICQRGNNKGTTFFSDEDFKSYLEILSRYSFKWDLEIWAYCLMSNHIHILAVPKGEQSLAKGIGGTNLVYTQYMNRRYQRSGRLWQNRFFSAIIERETYLWAAARYIERNPVRASLVKRAEDYPWSSARAHVLQTKDRILSGEEWLKANEIDGYREFLGMEEKNVEDFIRKATSTGRPFGSAEFVGKVGKIVQRSLIPKKAGRPAEL
jgi:putative transposase